MNMQQKNTYRKQTNRYDDVLTARKWWSWIYMHLIWRVDDNVMTREVMKMIPDDFGGKLLDVPVGTAIFTAAKYGTLSHAQIVGLDYSREMLAVAKQRKEACELKNLTLIQGDVGNLPFGDGSFDIVLSMNGFHVFPDKRKAFDETYRVLRPGGCFCGCFYVKGERKPADWLVRHFLNKKGLFRPPHFTLAEASTLLSDLYDGNVVLQNHRSMLIFKCIKPNS